MCLCAPQHSVLNLLIIPEKKDGDFLRIQATLLICVFCRPGCYLENRLDGSGVRRGSQLRGCTSGPGYEELGAVAHA